MFGKLRDKLKETLSIFSKKTEEVAEEIPAPTESVVKAEKKEKKEITIKEKHAQKEISREHVLILHGWGDNANSGFIPEIRDFLNKNNYKVLSLNQPNTDAPKFTEWFSFIESEIALIGKGEISIIGHSMGGLLALKLAEKYKIHKLILVAPVGVSPSENYFKLMEHKLTKEELHIFREYQRQSLDLKKIKNNVTEIAFIFGVKDPWITTEILGDYTRQFKDFAEINSFDQYGHMSESENFKKLPILEELFQRKIKIGLIEHREKIDGVNITYFVHGTTIDNEQGKSTGWLPGKLSTLGIQQSKDLKDKIKEKHFDAIFCSDLQRAIDSAALTFGKNVISDARLRECNYGVLNGAEEEKVDYSEHIVKPFPNGENLKEVERRIAEFLNFLYDHHYGKHIAILAHKAPQLALDVLLQGKTWEQAIAEDWRLRKAWQPGWEYRVTTKVEVPPQETISITEQPKSEKKSFFGRIKQSFSKKEEAIEPAKSIPPEKEEIKEKRVEKKEPEHKEVEQPKEEKKGFFGKLKETVTTKTISQEKFEELFWDLELVLLEHNVSVEVIEKIKQDLAIELVDKPLPWSVEKKIEETLKNTLTSILTVERKDLLAQIKGKSAKPFIIAFFGVNGAGKTTSIAKLTKYLQLHNHSVVLAACDTFRAAAIQQLEEHANKLNVKIIKHAYGADAAAVAYDAVKYAEKNKIDVVLIDTAGRLHSNTNLMAELEKIIRIAKPDLNIFVGESITGNDCIEQARTFNKLVQLDGVILTKADVDEKGGAPLSIAYTIKKPILFLGSGQKYEDLEEFNPELIVKRLGF